MLLLIAKKSIVHWKKNKRGNEREKLLNESFDELWLVKKHFDSKLFAINVDQAVVVAQVVELVSTQEQIIALFVYETSVKRENELAIALESRQSLQQNK